jgi:hypothetical protein
MADPAEHISDSVAPALAQKVADMTGCYVALVLMQPVRAEDGVAAVVTASGFSIGDNEDIWLLSAATGILSSAVRRIEETESTDPESEAHRTLIRAAAAALLASDEGVH